MSVAAASLNQPTDVSTANDGTVYIADSGNNRIARLRGGVLTSVATVGSPNGVAVAPDGSLYVTELALPRVLRVDPATGTVTTALGE